MKGYVNNEPGYETMELMEDSVLYVLERKSWKNCFRKTCILPIGDGVMLRWNCLPPRNG